MNVNLESVATGALQAAWVARDAAASDLAAARSHATTLQSRRSEAQVAVDRAKEAVATASKALAAEGGARATEDFHAAVRRQAEAAAALAAFDEQVLPEAQARIGSLTALSQRAMRSVRDEESRALVAGCLLPAIADFRAAQRSATAALEVINEVIAHLRHPMDRLGDKQQTVLLSATMKAHLVPENVRRLAREGSLAAQGRTWEVELRTVFSLDEEPSAAAVEPV